MAQRFYLRSNAESIPGSWNSEFQLGTSASGSTNNILGSVTQTYGRVISATEQTVIPSGDWTISIRWNPNHPGAGSSRAFSWSLIRLDSSGNQVEFIASGGALSNQDEFIVEVDVEAIGTTTFEPGDWLALRLTSFNATSIQVSRNHSSSFVEMPDPVSTDTPDIPFKEAALALSPRALWIPAHADGSALVDESGNNYHATLVGSPTVSPQDGPGSGLPGHMVLNGVDQYASLTTLAGFGPNIATSTFALWMRTTTTAAPEYAFGTVNDGTSLIWILRLNEDANLNADQGKFHIHMRDAAGGSTFRVGSAVDTDLFDGEWHLLVVRFQADQNPPTATIRIDGQNVPVEYSSTQRVIQADTAEFDYPLYLGANNSRGSTENPVEMDVAAFALWDANLTDQQADTLYTSAVEVGLEGGLDLEVTLGGSLSQPVPKLSGPLSVEVGLSGTLDQPEASVGQLSGSLPVEVDLSGSLDQPVATVPEASGSLDVEVNLSGSLAQPEATVPELSASIDVEVDLGGALSQPVATVEEITSSLDVEVGFGASLSQPIAAIPALEGSLDLEVDLGGSLAQPEATVPSLASALDVVVDLGGELAQPIATIPEVGGSLDVEVGLGGTLTSPPVIVPEIVGSLSVDVGLGGSLNVPTATVREVEGSLGVVIDLGGTLTFVPLLPPATPGGRSIQGVTANPKRGASPNPSRPVTVAGSGGRSANPRRGVTPT